MKIKRIKYMCKTFYPLEEKNQECANTLRKLKKKVGEDYDDYNTMIFKSVWKKKKFIGWKKIKK